MQRLAANLSMLFTEHPERDRPAAAAAAGFRGAEWQFPYGLDAAELADLVAAAGLEPVLINTPLGPGGELGLGAVPGRVDDFRAGVIEARDYARRLGATRVHVMAGAAKGEAPRACYVDNLRWAAALLADAGLLACIEPLNGRDAPGYHLGGSDEAAEVIEAVGAPNLALQFDSYHLQILEGDLTARLRALRPLLGHVQIAGVPDRHEPDHGELDNHWLLAELDRLGWDGWVGCEYRPAADTLTGLTWATPYGIRGRKPR